MDKYSFSDKVRRSQTNPEPHADTTGDDKLRSFYNRKRNLILFLMVSEILGNLIMSIQEGTEISRICWQLLILCAVYIVMKGTWTMGFLVWVFQIPSDIFYVIS